MDAGPFCIFKGFCFLSRQRAACIHNGGQIPCAGACGGARRHLIYRAAQRVQPIQVALDPALRRIARPACTDDPAGDNVRQAEPVQGSAEPVRSRLAVRIGRQEDAARPGSRMFEAERHG